MTTTTREIAAAIDQLHETLRRTYGADYAFSVMARGKTVAASTYRTGYVPPIVETDTVTDEVASPGRAGARWRIKAPSADNERPVW